MEVYINGEKPSSINYADTTTGSIRTGAHLSIGRDEGDTSRDFEGYVENLIVFDKCLTADEVKELYKQDYSFSLTFQENKLAKSENDGLTNDGTYLYISLDHNLEKRKLSEALLPLGFKIGQRKIQAKRTFFYTGPLAKEE